jgi:hypothetical protein
VQEALPHLAEREREREVYLREKAKTTEGALDNRKDPVVDDWPTSISVSVLLRDGKGAGGVPAGFNPSSTSRPHLFWAEDLRFEEDPRFVNRY